MHKKKAQELGLRLYDVPEIAARAASGPLSMNQSTVATINYGVVVARTTFALCDLVSYTPDLILLGSNALEILEWLQILRQIWCIPSKNTRFVCTPIENRQSNT